MIKRSIITGTGFAALAVILGAFGAHGLDTYVKNGTLTAHDISSYETGVRYQFYHAFGLILLGILAKLFGETKMMRGAYTLFTIGILLFSGSIYILSTAAVTGLEWGWLGPVTPIGGLCFIVGWVFVVVTFSGNKSI